MSVISRMITTMAAGAVVVFVGSVSSVLLFNNLISVEQRQSLACFVGMEQFGGTACVADEIARMRAEMAAEAAALRAALERDRAAIQTERLRLAAELRSIEEMVLDATPVITQVPSGNGSNYVVVVSTYRDADARKGLVGAACFYATDNQGPDVRLPLGRMSSTAALQHSTLDADQLAAFSIDAPELTRLQRLCPWPQAGS